MMGILGGFNNTNLNNSTSEIYGEEDEKTSTPCKCPRCVSTAGGAFVNSDEPDTDDDEEHNPEAEEPGNESIDIQAHPENPWEMYPLFAFH